MWTSIADRVIEKNEVTKLKEAFERSKGQNREHCLIDKIRGLCS
jgi:hypothetical protein